MFRPEVFLGIDNDAKPVLVINCVLETIHVREFNIRL